MAAVAALGRDPPHVLETPLPQTLLNYPDDGHGFHRHRRVILKRLEGVVWLALSPELNARPYNIIEILKKVIGRAALFPGDIADEYYVFDLITRQALLPYLRGAEIQIAILGDAVDPPDARTVNWFIAESSHPRFSEQIDCALLVGGGTGLYFHKKGVEFAARSSDKADAIASVVTLPSRSRRAANVLQGGTLCFRAKMAAA